MAKCPRCVVDLEGAMVGEAETGICPQCDGTLVSQRRMIPLMEAITKELAKVIDVDAEINKVPVREGPSVCPKCSEAMTAFGYMGTQLVHLNRCSPCEVVWMDVQEMGVATMLYARTNKRSDSRSTGAGGQEEFFRMMHAMLQGQRNSNRVGMVLKLLG